MSEAELHGLRARLRGGILNKARRGELHGHLRIGFVYTPDGRVALDPDTQVQDSVRLLFQTFFRTGAAHATVKYFREQHLLFPIRLAAGSRTGELAWMPLGLGRAVHLLHNPWYAGASTFGRHRWRKQPDGRIRRERMPREQWHALLRDAHPGYISWEEHERLEHQLHAGAKALGWERRHGPPREGPALLQGRVVCGLCGSRMQIRYRPRRSGQLIPDYVCPGRGRGYAEPLCQSILGAEIDAAVGALLVDAVTRMALEMAVAVQAEIQAHLDEADRLRHRQVERAQYDADRARHCYMQVDPANRLVADSLEADWIPPALVAAINAGRCVAFVGSGFSAAAKLPTWETLLKELAARPEAEPVRAQIEERLTEKTSHAFDEVAQALEDVLGREVLTDLLRAKFHYAEPTPAMQRRRELLEEIPFRAVLTTNYDRTLKGETPSPASYRSLLRSVQTPWINTLYVTPRDRKSRPLLKLHGDLDSPETIVLTRRDYRRLLYENPHYLSFLRAYLLSHTVLYIGFSFTDAYLNELRSELLTRVDQRVGSEPVAYAIVNDVPALVPDALVVQARQIGCSGSRTMLQCTR
jgi:hypothetical protein